MSFFDKAEYVTVWSNGDLPSMTHGEEIVRCIDCRFRCLDECTRIDEGFKDYWFAIEPDGFCKWGERNE